MQLLCYCLWGGLRISPCHECNCQSPHEPIEVSVADAPKDVRVWHDWNSGAVHLASKIHEVIIEFVECFNESDRHYLMKPCASSVTLVECNDSFAKVVQGSTRI